MDQLLVEREFRFTNQDFDRVRKLIYEHAGISLADSKQTMVYSRLSRRLRELGISDFASYLDGLKDADSPEWQGFVNSLTTNLTSFFREPYHFPMLADYLSERRAGPDKLRLWCAAASTGEEPYSIAMTIVETLGERAQASLVATDIDTNVLATARRGVYASNGIDSLSAERRKRFLLKGKGPMAGFARVKPELSRLIEFRQLNLIAPKLDIDGPFDVIFCRNVLIYFDAETKQTILRKLHQLLRPDGLLFVGHSENFAGAREMFAAQGKTVYRRVGA